MNSLSGKRVLVTGADGFIGSHLTERLVEAGADVRAFCIYNSQGSWGWLDDAPPQTKRALDVRLGDIRDPVFVAAACRDIDIVFHLAALIAIPYSYSAAQSFVETNVKGTLNVLEAARQHGVGRVIHTSTSEVYGTPETTPITEAHALRAQSPYAATKIAADQLALSYFRSHEVPVTVLRPFNTYGPRQSARAVLPTILGQQLAGRSPIQLGSLDPRRDLTYVVDTVEGFVLAAAASGVEGETIQLGTGRAVSIGELFEIARRITGHDAEVCEDARRVRPAKSEVMVLLSDYSLAKERLGWAPATSLETGVERTAAWIRDHLDRYNLDFLHR